MGCGEMMLIRGVYIGTFYKISRHRDSSGCGSEIVIETNRSSCCKFDETILWHQRTIHIGEKGSWAMQTKWMF